MSEESGAALVGLAGLIMGAMAGCCIGYAIGTGTAQQEAVRAGAARYYLDANNENKFEYLGTK